MTKHSDPVGTELIRPATRLKTNKATKRRKVAGPLKAFVGPRTLAQALDQAVSPQRRQEIAEQSGYDAQAQKLTFEPYLRALLVRQIEGGSLHDLQDGMGGTSCIRRMGHSWRFRCPAYPKPMPSARRNRSGTYWRR